MSNDKQHNRSGFSVPSGYFDQLTDQVMREVKLSRQSDSAGFEVPDSYMDQLTDRIMESVQDNDSKVITMHTTKTVSDNTSWLIPLITAAAIGLLLFSLQGLWGTTPASFEILEDQEVMDYVMNLETSMDQDAIELLFADNDVIDYINVDTQINDDELMDYLIDEVDLNQMYSE
jgi:hypothetical protein